MVPPDGRIEPGKRREQLVLPLPFERDDARDLAVVEVERDVLQLGADAAGSGRETRGLALGAPAPRRSEAWRASSRSLRRASARRSFPRRPARCRPRRPSRRRAAPWRGRRCAEISTKRCEMKITERPVLLWLRTTSITRSARLAGSAAVISSRMQHVGLDGERPREIEDALDGERDVPRRVAEIEVGNAELLDPLAERLDRRLRSAADSAARRDRGSATVPGRPTPARRAAPRRARRPCAPRRGSGCVRQSA